jgi:signal transduction histidine kinase
MRKSFAIVAFLLMYCSCCEAQTKTIDSLIYRINRSNNGLEKFDLLLKLSEQSINPDSLLPYIQLAETLAARTKNEKKMAEAAFARAGYYARKNLIDSGLTIINKLIQKFEKHKESEAYLKYIFFKAKLLDRGNHYSQALVQLYNVVETAAGQKDTLTLIQAKTGIGWVLIEMEQYKEALKWLYSAANTSPDKNYYKNYGALFSNMAAAYNALGKKDSSLFFIKKAIADARQNDNLLFLATALSMEAKIFVDNGMTKLAEAPLQEVLQIRKQLNDPFYIVFDMSSLASYYAKTNQPEKGIALCTEGIAIAKELKLPSQLLMIYKALAENYKAAGDKEEYGKTLEYIIALKDSFNSINSAKMLVELHESNETQKREKTINEQKLSLTTKNYLLFGSALFLLMAAVIAWLVFKNYRKRQQLSMQLAIEKEKIMAAQAVKDAGEQERKRIAADLHDNLGAQANAILYSAELLLQEQNEGKHLVNELHYTAKDMLTSLRETLWVLNKTDVTAADIWLRIINFCSQMNRHYPGIKMITEGTIPSDVHFNSAKALNIVFIIQEGVNNALRHASATVINVHSEYSRDHWRLCVKDNGKGFTDLTVREGKEHYGLSNMRERATAASLNLTISSKPNEGTVIQVVAEIKELIQKEY